MRSLRCAVFLNTHVSFGGKQIYSSVSFTCVMHVILMYL